MKRFACLILTFCLLFTGCSVSGDRIKEPVLFYYVFEDYEKDMEQVIVSEVREAAGHRNDISYLLALYSMGPSNEDLKSPLPRNTRIALLEHNADNMVLSLSDAVLNITEAEFTLACACISMTCMELTDVQQITVTCGDRTITMQRDHLLLNDNMVQIPQEETK